MSTAIETGFTKEEMAQLSGPVDVTDADDAPEAETEEAPEPEAKAEETAPEAKAVPQADKTNGKGTAPPAGFVPQAALHEARKQLQEQRERISRMEAAFATFTEQAKAQANPQSQVQVPDEHDDPVGYLKHQLAETQKQLQSINGMTKQQAEQTARERAAQDVLDWYAGETRNYAKTTPDFNDAYQYLADARDKELEIMGFDDPIERANRLQYEEGMIIYRAKQSGKNPAEMLYAAAKARGYAGTQPAVNKLDNLKKVQSAAKSLGNGSPPSDGDMTLERLSELYDTDPKEAEKLFARMARAGKLG